MQPYSSFAQDGKGNVIAGASVLVLTAGGNNATIYSDNSSTALGNPFNTIGSGYYEFYAANGTYTVRITKTGFDTISFPIVLNDPTTATNRATAGGTANALTASFGLSSYTDGLQIQLVAIAANTSTTPTVALDGMAAKTIVKYGNQPLIAGDIYAAGHVLDLVYRSSASVFELLNPKNLSDTINVVSVAALKALSSTPLIDGETRNLLGYYTAGDGGGQQVYWSASSSATANEGSVFLPTGHVGNGRWLSVDTNVIGVKHFGAKGDWNGSTGTDDTTSIQATINALIDTTNGGRVHIPKGLYKITSTLTITNSQGFLVCGDGETSTRIVPTAALVGVPVLKCTNCRDYVLTDFGIDGNASAKPEAAITFHRATTGGYAPTAMKCRNLLLGGLTADINNGIQFTADLDLNNADGTFENIKIRNFAEAGYSIEHSDSIQHRIIGGVIEGEAAGTVGIKTNGGAFTAIGVAIYVKEWCFDIAGLQNQVINIIGCTSESVAKIIRQTSTGFPHVSFVGFHKKGSTTTVTTVDIQSVNANFSMTGCTMNLGQPSQTFSISDASSYAKFVNNHLGVTTFSWAGQLFLSGNTYSAGTVTYSPGASAELRQISDSGGGIGDIGFRLGTAGRTGAIVLEHLTATAALDFNLTAVTYQDLTITVTGAVEAPDINTVTLGVENSAMVAGIGYVAWVSAANTVTVRAFAIGAATPNPPSATFRVDVWRH